MELDYIHHGIWPLKLYIFNLPKVTHGYFIEPISENHSHWIKGTARLKVVALK